MKNYNFKHSLFYFVDLGLPSGKQWASCNLGACEPEEYGLYFAWGETEGYYFEVMGNDIIITNEDGSDTEKGFFWGDYKFTTAATGATDTTFRGGLTKYNNKSTNGIIDNKLVLEAVDDAANVRDENTFIPTMEECQELISNTTQSWETINGVNGIRLFSKVNDESIFLPMCGYIMNKHITDDQNFAVYITSTLKNTNTMSYNAVCFDSTRIAMALSQRYLGAPIRVIKRN